MKNWSEVFTTSNAIKAKMVEMHLRVSDIPVVTIDTRDSSYNAFGLIRLRVPSDLLMKSLHLINEMEEEEEEKNCN